MTETHFMLTSAAGGPAPVLKSVQAHGRIDDVLCELTLRQTYRNAGTQPLEVIYTFPLPLRSTLLGFASELNGVRRVGTMVEKREAEQTYETALEAGDAPVLLEASGQGLHSANIGNLKPGDEIVLEVRFVQCLSFEQGRLRLAVPTTVAPRYGDPAAADLQPQQVPVVDLAVEYPLSLSLVIGRALADAEVQCATHAFDLAPGEAGTRRLTLRPGARLDRDVVLLLTPREARPSLIVRAHDAAEPAAPVVMMAALQPRGAAANRPLVLKLLVDGSGSMAGDGMHSARTALRGLVEGLNDRDQVSLSCFGSHTETRLQPAPADATTRQRLGMLIAQLDANLGGTELPSALAATLALPAPHGADVLLITDGEVWQAEVLAAQVRQHRHRVFAIGVGSAPAESVLRPMAEASGGACEFATPGESLEAAARRMLQRMRQPRWQQPRIDWGDVQPAWQVPPPAGLFAGDSVIALAGFPAGLAPRTSVRLLADDETGHAVELARCEAEAPCEGDALPRLAASARLATLPEAAAQAMALRYQLMSSYTHCVLVHERSEEERVNEVAAVHRVGSMLAAGWGGSATVRDIRTAPMAACAPLADFAPIERCSAMAGPAGFSLAHAAGPETGGRFASLDVPDAWLQRAAGTGPDPLGADSLAAPAPAEPQRATPLQPLVQRIERFLSRSGGQRTGLSEQIGPLADDELHSAVLGLQVEGLDADAAWVVLAYWASLHDPAGERAQAMVAAWLAPALQVLGDCSPHLQSLRTRLGDASAWPWAPSRADRLRRAIGWPSTS